MLAALTQDLAIVDWIKNEASGSNAWGPREILSPGMQREAFDQFAAALSKVGLSQDICLTAHGNDTHIGDADETGWTWSVEEIASALSQNTPEGYDGRVLIEVCSESISDFAARLALSLERKSQLSGVWIYGYQKPVPIDHTFPDPNKLDKNVELQGHQVGGQR